MLVYAYKSDYTDSMPKIAKILIIALSLFLVVLAVTKSKEQTKKYVTEFNRIYLADLWRGGSGQGSDPGNAQPYMDLLNDLLQNSEYQVVVDLGCGDWQIMQGIVLPEHVQYHGYDVSTVVLGQVKSKHSKQNVQFHHINSLHDFAKKDVKGDLLIVKDVLQHLPNSEIKYFLSNILPKFRRALITNAKDVPGLVKKPNSDIMVGKFRPLLLQQQPFNLQDTEVLLEYKGPELKQVLLYTNPNAT